mmetsp:Transcript_24725/g.62596  ORF Transcript_24725/g.62596 Transcript_24725/m.62596 type:complete len:563 (-) Transcript_24725:81-1769(-)
MRGSFAVILLLSIAASAAAITNEQIEKKVDLSSHIAEVTVDVSIADGESEYVFFLPKSVADRVAAMKVVDGKDEGELSVKKVASPAEAKDAVAFSVATGSSVESISITYYLFQAQRPFPAEIGQEHPHSVVYSDSSLFLSPYASVSQSLSIVTPGAVISKTEMDDMQSREDGVEYGPFEDVEAFAEGTQVSIHFETNSPFFNVTSVVKDIEISFWGSSNIVEDYEIRHNGAKLNHGFDRLSYQRGMSMQQADPAPSAIRSFNMPLPKTVSDVYYRDTIGNISTSRFNVGSNEALLEFIPRFPLFGGWKTEFTVGYTLPTSDMVFVSSKDASLYSVRIPISTSIKNAYAESASVRLVLPEGATNIKVVNSDKFDMVESEIRYTYVDTVGRPVRVITKKNVIDESNDVVEVQFNFSAGTMYYEPFQLVILFFCLFATSMFYVRFSLRIEGQQAAEERVSAEEGAAELNIFVEAVKAVLSSIEKLDLEKAKKKIESLKKLDAFNSKFSYVKSKEATLRGIAQKVEDAWKSGEKFSKKKNDKNAANSFKAARFSASNMLAQIEEAL